MGALDHRVPRVVDVLGHAEVVERHEHGALVEHAENHALAEQHGDDADTQIELFDLAVAVAAAERDPAVLWLALLGDVEVRHDLEPADDRRGEPVDGLRDAGALQHAVDAVAHREFVLVGLDVDVGRPLADRLDEQVVDELDDARLLGLLDLVLRRVARVDIDAAC